MIRVTLADLNASTDTPADAMIDRMERTSYGVAIAWVLTALALAGAAIYALVEVEGSAFGAALCFPGVIVCLALAWSERPTRQHLGSTPTTTTRE